MSLEILDQSGYVVYHVPNSLKETIMSKKNFWQLSYEIARKEGRGRPTKHKGMYLSKDSAMAAMRRVVRVQHGKVRRIVVTNAAKTY